MRFLTGDECGLLKEFVPEIAHRKLAQEDAASTNNNKPDIVLPVHYDNIQKVNRLHGIQRIDPHELQTRSRGVVDMTLLRSSSGGDIDDEEEENAAFSFASLRQNGCVEIWQTANRDSSAGTRTSKFAQYQRLSLSGDIFEETRKYSPIPNVPVKPLALAAIGGGGGGGDATAAASSQRRLLAADTHGNMVILKASLLANNDATSNNKPVSILHRFSAYDNTSSDNITLTYTKGKVINTQLASSMAINSVTHHGGGAAAVMNTASPR